jgi:hypothetical protein
VNRLGRQRSGRQAEGGVTPVHLAGWLFADLLLGVVIVVLGAYALVDAKPGSAPSAAASSATTGPGTGSSLPGVSQRPYVVDVPVDTAALLRRDAREEERLAAALTKRTEAIRSRHAGIVLTFGYDPNIARGQRLAGTVNRVLESARPRVLEGAATRDLANLSGRDRVRIEIYLFTE